MYLYHFTDIGIGSTGCAYLLHFCGKVIVITDDMTTDKRIAKKLFFRKYFFIVRLLYQVVIQGMIHLVGICRKTVSGMATERIISGHLPASRSMTIVSAPNNPI